eukprot:TRINITY_DN18010_c0_g1_i1.p1 TRINITY_DN18010_c0_g1~~TRINITY_DN18010_c0_g1_i1.p1  ORF type:complete len:564 (+),score=129.12 TRINITY_DN18010_c0_g1_i1:74-1693(+)
MVSPKASWDNLHSNSYAASNGAMQEDSMQSFIRNHMVSILQPFAEHVREVQARVESLAEDVLAVDGKCEKAGALLEQRHQDIMALWAGLHKTDGRLERLQADLNASNEERYRLEAYHESTKASLGKAHVDMQALSTTLNLLVAKSDDMETHVQALQAGQTKANKAMVEHGEGIATVNDLYKGINYRYMDMEKDMESLSKTVVANDRSIAETKNSMKRQSEEQARAIGKVTEQVELLEQMLGDTNRSLQRQGDNRRAMEIDVQKMKAFFDSDAGSITNFEVVTARLDETARSVNQLKHHVSRSDEALLTYKKELSVERRTVMDSIQAIEKRIVEHTADLQAVDETILRHSDQLKKGDRCTGELHKEFQGLEERTGTLALEMQKLPPWQKDTLRQLEAHGSGIQAVQSDVSQIIGQLREAYKDVTNLKTDLANTNTALGRLGGRFESCDRSMQGLSRGFQDAYRHVALGESGMLAPKFNPSPPGGAPEKRPSRPSTARALGGGGGGGSPSGSPTRTGVAMEARAPMGARPSTAGSFRQSRS